MCCMCLLRGPNGHIRVMYLTSRLSVSSWPPKLPSSSPDAHGSPLEAWTSRIHPHRIDMRCISVDLRGRGGRGCVMRWCYYGRVRGRCGCQRCCCRVHHRPLRALSFALAFSLYSSGVSLSPLSPGFKGFLPARLPLPLPLPLVC
jgi:hypothetical protein